MAAPFRGFLTSHNGSVNFLGDGTIFWGDGPARQLSRLAALSGEL